MRSFFGRFRRNRDENLDDSSYYRDEPTTNRFTAVLFGLFALFVTLLIAGGLFFGGRAVYRALNGTPAEKTSEQQQKQGDDQNKSPATPAPTGQPAPSQGPATQPNTDDTPSSVPSTGDTLPRTGDDL